MQKGLETGSKTIDNNVVSLINYYRNIINNLDKDGSGDYFIINYPKKCKLFKMIDQIDNYGRRSVIENDPDRKPAFEDFKLNDAYISIEEVKNF